MTTAKKPLPAWWNWPLDLSNPHLLARLADRGLLPTDVRDMMFYAFEAKADAVPGRWLIESMVTNSRADLIVEPDAAAERLVVVTVYVVDETR